MKRSWIALAACAACAGAPKKEPAAPAPSGASVAQARANAEPVPVAETPPAKIVESDPWAGRADLFVAPTVNPSTQVNLGAVERFSLPNGLEVILVPRKEVPIVDISLAVRAGRDEEPLDKGGLAQFTASMLRKGTAKRTSDQIAEAIDFVGGELDASASEEGTFVSCHARARDLALCLDLVADVSLRPKFPESEMAEIRDQLNAAVESAKDSPQSLAAEHLANLFYGEEDPRGRPMSKRSIELIDRAQLAAFHKTWFAPNNSLLVLSGDVDAKKLRGELQRTFGAWKKQALPSRVERSLPSPGVLKVRLVDKHDATQSTILLAGPGIKHSSPDFYAVRLMNYVLGGGSFSSRLMKVVRSEGGKTYGAHSSFAAGREPGPFQVSTFTRNTETTATLKLLETEIARMRAGGPTADELTAAKGNLIGGYGLHLETASDVARVLATAELDGLDRDYAVKYPERLRAVTVADAARAAAQHLQPSALVVVGKAEEVRPMLTRAGYTIAETVAYTDPVSATERRVASAPAAPSTAEDEAGRRLLGQALAAKGAISSVTDLSLSGHGTMRMQGQTVNVTVDEVSVPGKGVRQEMMMGPMKVTEIVTGGKVLIKQGGQVQEIPSPMAATILRQLWRDPNFILVHAGEPKARVRVLPRDGASYDGLEVVSPDGDATRLWLDAKTHLIARMTYSESGKETRWELTDYRPEAGVMFPRKASQSGGEGDLEVTYTKVEVNKGVEPSLFRP